MILGRIACLIVALTGLLALVRDSSLFIYSSVPKKLSVPISAKTQSSLSYLSRLAVVPHDEVHDNLSVPISAKTQSSLSYLSRLAVVPHDEVHDHLSVPTSAKTQSSLSYLSRSAVVPQDEVHDNLSVPISAKTQSSLSYLSRLAVVPHDEVHDHPSVSTSSVQRQSYLSGVMPKKTKNKKKLDGHSVKYHEAKLRERARLFSAVTLEQLSSWGWGEVETRRASRFFNKTRCEELTVFFYPEVMCKPSQLCLPVFNYFRHGDILPTALHGESWRVTDNPQEACIFLVVATDAKKQTQRYHLAELANRSSFHAAGRPGMNHVYISGGDKGERWNEFPSMMQAWPSASMPKPATKCYIYTEKDPMVHRVGFDVPFPNLPWSVSKPLVCNTSRHNCGTFEMKDRNTSKPRPLLSFWVGRNKTCPKLRSRVLQYLHDPHRNMFAVDSSNYTALNVVLDPKEEKEILATKAKFLPAPQGNGRASSFRLIEALSAGGVPVYIGETLEPPFSETLPFAEYALYFDSSLSLKDFYLYLRRTQRQQRNGVCEWNRLQSNAIWVYEHYFASDVRAVAGLLELLGRRIRGHLDPVTPTAGGFFKTAQGFCIKMAQLERTLEKRGNIPPNGGFPVDQEC